MKSLLDKLRVPAPTLKNRHTMMAGVCDRSSSMQNQALRKVHLVTHPSKPGSSNELLVRDPILNHVKNNRRRKKSLSDLHTHTHTLMCAQIGILVLVKGAESLVRETEP